MFGEGEILMRHHRKIIVFYDSVAIFIMFESLCKCFEVFFVKLFEVLVIKLLVT